MEMDLEGAPYAYTPFCDDRKDMDGFRYVEFYNKSPVLRVLDNFGFHNLLRSHF